MLDTLKLKNFTVFAEAEFDFSPGLNVIIGENGTGKSHVLKLGYAMLSALATASEMSDNLQLNGLLTTLTHKDEAARKTEIDKLITSQQERDRLTLLTGAAAAGIIKEGELAEKAVAALGTAAVIALLQQFTRPKNTAEPTSPTAEQPAGGLKIPEQLETVFKPGDGFADLLRWGAQTGAIECVVKSPHQAEHSLRASFTKTGINKDNFAAVNTVRTLPPPVFFPTHEVMTWYPEFLYIYEKYHSRIDQTYYDLCKMLGIPLLKHPPLELQSLADNLEKSIGGKARMNPSGRFYFQVTSGQKLEIPLVAEGIRKLATLAYLLRNGALTPGCTVFWDEPETNLNPKLLVTLSEVLVALARHGIQVVVTCHTLFLMHQLSFLVESMPSPERISAGFFSCCAGAEGVTVEEGQLLEDLSTVIALDEELALDDREQAFFHQTLR